MVLIHGVLLGGSGFTPQMDGDQDKTVIGIVPCFEITMDVAMRGMTESEVEVNEAETTKKMFFHLLQSGASLRSEHRKEASDGVSEIVGAPLNEVSLSQEGAAETTPDAKTARIMREVAAERRVQRMREEAIARRETLRVNHQMMAQKRVAELYGNLALQHPSFATSFNAPPMLPMMQSPQAPLPPPPPPPNRFAPPNGFAPPNPLYHPTALYHPPILHQQTQLLCQVVGR